MDRIADVTVIQLDSTEGAVLAQIIESIGDHPVDLVISDMAPNMSGVKVSDQSPARFLCELAPFLAGRVTCGGFFDRNRPGRRF